MSDTIVKCVYPDGEMAFLEDGREYRLRLDDIDPETGRAGVAGGTQLPGVRLQVFNLDIMQREEDREKYSDPENAAPPVACYPTYTHYILNRDLDRHPDIDFMRIPIIRWYGDQLLAVDLIDMALREFDVKPSGDIPNDIGALVAANRATAKRDKMSEEDAVNSICRRCLLGREFAE